jgi:hypothetical protein
VPSPRRAVSAKEHTDVDYQGNACERCLPRNDVVAATVLPGMLRIFKLLIGGSQCHTPLDSGPFDKPFGLGKEAQCRTLSGRFGLLMRRAVRHAAFIIPDAHDFHRSVSVSHWAIYHIFLIKGPYPSLSVHFLDVAVRMTSSSENCSQQVISSFTYAQILSLHLKLLSL